MDPKPLVLIGAALAACAVFPSTGSAGSAPSFQMLMRPDCLPEPQCGMQVEQAVVRQGRVEIRTTGAELSFDPASGAGVFRQRIGHPRDILRMQIEGEARASARLAYSGPGLAFVEFDAPRLDLRANGDSLFMLHAIRPVRITLCGAIAPAFHASFRANHIVCDEWGGFGLYCSRPALEDRFDPFEPTTAVYDLPADTVLWVAVFPPRPYDWRQSVHEQVVWHWSNQSAYPPDDVLAGWAKVGTIALLQSEVMLWKDWNLGFEPRQGAAEFARVRETLHRHGMRLLVYTSPYYFLRGTRLETAAMNNFENFTNWPPGTATGENIDLFLAEIARLVREHRPDGLYFDGQYTENPAALYLLARRARAIVGESGLLEWHSTNALGPERCSLPPADAYVDFILRGEGHGTLYDDEDYLRFFVSGYHVHNRIGVLCNNAARPTAKLVDRLLAVNGRMHTLAGWLHDGDLVRLTADYRRRLADVSALRERVERQFEQRQATVTARVRLSREEHRAMRSPPTWSEPVLRERFAALDGWRSFASTRNTAPFEPGPDGLRITARASTFAYLSRPLDRRVQGFVVQLRRGTDGGASWGPAAGMRWPQDVLLRVGLRNDGLIQADIAGEQRLGGSVQADEWVWLRARWGRRTGVIETSGDGRTFTMLWSFEHAGRFDEPASHLLVGKVPYHGRPEDFPEPGPVGTCVVRSIEVY